MHTGAGAASVLGLHAHEPNHTDWWVVFVVIGDTVGPRMRRHCCAQSTGSAPTVARARARRQCFCHALAVSSTHHRVILRSFCARSAGSAPAVARALAASMIVQRAHCVAAMSGESAHSRQHRTAANVLASDWASPAHHELHHSNRTSNVNRNPHRTGPWLLPCWAFVATRIAIPVAIPAVRRWATDSGHRNPAE